MFTGLIEETGAIRALRHAGRSLQLTVGARTVLEGLRLGDSIAVNGVCLTVVRFDRDGFTADVMPETYTRTNFSALTTGARVNLERTLPLGGRLGGHLVQGHVDGTGTIVAMEEEEIAVRVTVTAPLELLRYLAPKGSVAIDGISLTVATLIDDRFQVSLIPHSLTHTNLADRRPGDLVNLETDLLAKYVERLLTTRMDRPQGRQPESGGLTESFLRENGF